MRLFTRKPEDRALSAPDQLAELGVIYRNGDERWHPSPTLLDDEEE